MNRRCTTHHHACDCREDRFAELEANVKELRECLQIAFGAFAHDDDGPVWADSLIARTERVLAATSAEKKIKKLRHGVERRGSL